MASVEPYISFFFVIGIEKLVSPPFFTPENDDEEEEDEVAVDVAMWEIDLKISIISSSVIQEISEQ